MRTTRYADPLSQAPKFEFVSNARPSLFAYPAPTKPPKKEAVAKVATAVLSTTARAKAREKKKAAEDNVAQVYISHMSIPLFY